jgi:hypothetical protein
MSDALYRLVYYSRNLVAGGELELRSNLESILDRSRVNNSRDAITGALLFNSGCFAQILEGPLQQVEAAFERIQQDDRHGEVSLLALDPIAERSFPNWAMGYVGGSAERSKSFAAIGQDSGFDPARLSGEQLFELLKDLAVQEEAEAA